MKRAVSELLVLLPELQSQFDDDIQVFGAGYSDRIHSVYGQLLNPYLISHPAENRDTRVLRKVFNFVEKLASSGNLDEENLVATTICEELGDDLIVLDRARLLMGPATLKLSREIEIFWGREEA